MTLIKRKARKEYICTKCKKVIAKDEYYFCEDRFLASLNKNQTKICSNCFESFKK